MKRATAISISLVALLLVSSISLAAAQPETAGAAGDPGQVAAASSLASSSSQQQQQQLQPVGGAEGDAAGTGASSKVPNALHDVDKAPNKPLTEGKASGKVPPAAAAAAAPAAITADALQGRPVDVAKGGTSAAFQPKENTSLKEENQDGSSEQVDKFVASVVGGAAMASMEQVSGEAVGDDLELNLVPNCLLVML